MHIEKGHVNKTSTTLSEKHVETDPGIECCDFYNIDESCFPNCKQHDIPLDRIEESSRDMTCEDWLPIIKSCRDGKEKIKILSFDCLLFKSRHQQDYSLPNFLYRRNIRMETR